MITVAKYFKNKVKISNSGDITIRECYIVVIIVVVQRQSTAAVLPWVDIINTA